MIIFHRALISTGILFGIVYALWEFTAYRATGSRLSLGLSIGAAVMAVAMGYYLKNLQRFLGRKE